MLHLRNDETDRYPLFKQLLPEYKSKDKLLDFGGNQGNLLYFSNGDILEKNYTCIDVSKKAIAIGKKEFPKAHFIHWDRYNEMYNHNGLKNIMPDYKIYNKFVWAYSVFSHIIISDIIEFVIWLKTLKPKKIILSYLTNDGDDNSKKVLNYFYSKRINKYNKCVDFRENNNEYFYLTDNYYGHNKGDEFIAVYKTSLLIKTLKEYGIKAKKIIADKWPIPFLEIT